MSKVMLQSHPRNFGERAGHLNSNRSGSNKCKGQLAANLLASCVFDGSHFFGPFERTQYFVSYDVRVVERFETCCKLSPFVVSKIVVLDPSREDKEVIYQQPPRNRRLYLSRCSRFRP